MSDLPTTPSDAPTPDVDANAWSENNHTRGEVVLADFARRLERERDEARAELAKLKAPTSPTEGSAVEWAWRRPWTTINGKEYAHWNDFIRLAWRADAAEQPGWYQTCMKIGVLLAPITQAAGVVEAVEELYIQRADLLHQVGDLRSQLAAAQAERDEWKANRAIVRAALTKKEGEG